MTGRARFGAKLRIAAVTVMCVSSMAGCWSSGTGGRAAGTGPVERLAVTVTVSHPHDPAAFTEGLLVDDQGRMFESLGQYGASKIRQVDIITGAPIAEQPLDPALFGEGLAENDGELFQLTWREGLALRWDADSLATKGTVAITGEGWGLAFDEVSNAFIQSDGTSRLTFRDPVTFEVTGSVEVHLNGHAIDQLNELEVIDGEVYANRWHTDEIVRIDPFNGRVDAVIDASALWKGPGRSGEMVLNGIAHRPDDPPNHLLLTGKNWPYLYEVDLVTAPRTTTSVATTSTTSTIATTSVVATNPIATTPVPATPTSTP